LRAIWIPIALLALTLPAGAASTHTSVQDFEAAAGRTSYLIDDYSDWVGPGSETTDGVRTGYTVSSNRILSLDAGDFGDGALGMSFGFGELTYTFDEPIYAFGFDLSRRGGTLEFDEVGGEVHPGCCTGGEFHGVVFDQPVSEVIVFINASILPTQMYTDNLRVVPEAGPIVTLVAGVAFAAMLGARRRKS
jgi:hypothetical protein